MLRRSGAGISTGSCRKAAARQDRQQRRAHRRHRRRISSWPRAATAVATASTGPSSSTAAAPSATPCGPSRATTCSPRRPSRGSWRPAVLPQQRRLGPEHGHRFLGHVEHPEPGIQRPALGRALTAARVARSATRTRAGSRRDPRSSAAARRRCPARARRSPPPGWSSPNPRNVACHLAIGEVVEDRVHHRAPAARPGPARPAKYPSPVVAHAQGRNASFGTSERVTVAIGSTSSTRGGSWPVGAASVGISCGRDGALAGGLSRALPCAPGHPANRSFSGMIVDRLSASGAPSTGVALRAKRGHPKTAVLVPACICMQ